MKKYCLSLIILVLFNCPVISQSAGIFIPSFYPGLGTYSLHHTDVFSFSTNQASLAQLKNVSAGVFGERRFLLAELNNYTVAVGIPTRAGNVGLKTVYAGFSEYNETQMGLAYARSLGKKMDIGVQFNYNSIRISGYGNGSAVSAEIGTIMHLTEKLHAGIHINDPVGGKFGKGIQEKLPTVFSFGIGYDASGKFLVSASIIKEEDSPVTVNAGIHYKIIPQLHARAGISTTTSSLWAGVGFMLKSVRIDVATSYHPLLGVTPGLLLLFDLKKNKE